MADLVVTADKVGVVFPAMAEIVSVICAETITKGQALFIDSNGKAQLADANVAGEQQTRLLALEGGGAGQVISAVQRGHVYGFTLSQAYDAPIYQSDTTGALADAAGTLSVPVGIVAPLTDGSNLEKVLFFNPRHRGDYS